MTIKYGFQGGKDLEKALAQIEKAATRKTLSRRALKKAAEPLAQAARDAAPARSSGNGRRKLKDGRIIHRPRGATKIRINVGARLSKRQARMNKRLGKSEVEIHIGTRDRLARLLEFGTFDTPAFGFMRAAWNSEGHEKALQRMADELWPEIERTAARQAKKRGY